MSCKCYSWPQIACFMIRVVSGNLTAFDSHHLNTFPLAFGSESCIRIVFITVCRVSVLYASKYLCRRITCKQSHQESRILFVVMMAATGFHVTFSQLWYVESKPEYPALLRDMAEYIVEMLVKCLLV